MRPIIRLLAAAAVGLALAWVLHVNPASLPHSTTYRLAAYLLLTVGLYGATYGIDLSHARADRRIIISAATVGVAVKALIIGGSLALAFSDPLFLILGIAVAQIDPLSVAALMGDDRMSVRARSVLAAWSSFDDPVTVILAVYGAAVAGALGVDANSRHVAPSLAFYGVELVGNLALAGVAYLVWRRIGDREWLRYAVLAACGVIAVATGWMLAVALIGLFARPAALGPVLARAIRWATIAAAVALGVLLRGGLDLWRGISLGAVAFVAQAIVAWPLTAGMPRRDRVHLAAAQQHGITAIILALTLEIQFPGVVAVIAPTILTANLLHVVVNRMIDRRTGLAPGPATVPPAASETP
jgi:NhaP-type Na+/H+ or K+/H+ antiporter